MNTPNETNETYAVVAPQGGGMLTTFRDIEQMYRFSEFLSKSPLLPDAFRGNPGSVMIALNMAQRLRMDPLMVCQNIVIVHGNAGISGKMAIALLNRSPKYRRIEYRYVNGKDYTDGMQVVGHRTDDPEDKNPDYGTAITLAMAKAEGWAKNQKWQTMPEQMLRYRAAAFFARAFVPEELLGMQTAEELEDIDYAASNPGIRNVTEKKTRGLRIAKNLVIDETPAEPAPAPAAEPEKKDETKSILFTGEKVEQAEAAKPVVEAKEPEKTETKTVTLPPTKQATKTAAKPEQSKEEKPSDPLDKMNAALVKKNMTWSNLRFLCMSIGLEPPDTKAPLDKQYEFAEFVYKHPKLIEQFRQEGLEL